MRVQGGQKNVAGHESTNDRGGIWGELWNGTDKGTTVIWERRFLSIHSLSVLSVYLGSTEINIKMYINIHIYAYNLCVSEIFIQSLKYSYMLYIYKIIRDME